MRFFASLIAVVLAASAAAQERPQGAIRVRTALVTVPVVVTDRDGRYVPDLRVDEFTLLDDGVKQPVQLFAAASEPLQVALLLDTSQSTSGVLDQIRTAALEFLQNLEARDRVMVVRFNVTVATLAPLEADREAAEKAVRGVTATDQPGTRLRDAVAEIAEKFRRIESRKAIVLLSDGWDQGSSIEANRLLAIAAEAGTPIYAVYYGRVPEPIRRSGLLRRKRYPPGPRIPTEAWERARKYLEELSELTAGRTYPSDIPELRVAFLRIARELRQQYVLGFYPTRAQLDGRLHALLVQVSRRDASVRARSAYRAQ